MTATVAIKPTTVNTHCPGVRSARPVPGERYEEEAGGVALQEESGLARPEIYDWGSAVPKILERHLVDIAIVLIGTNDGQDIRSEAGRLTFGSPEWAAAYRAAVDEIIGAFRENGASVYWVALPPMRSASHEEAVAVIAELQRERVLANGAKYIDVRPQFAAPDGSFAQNGIGIDGTETRLRSLDGIKFIKAGNDKLSTLVFDAISADLGLGGPGPVAAEGGEGFANEALANLPVFGTELADGTTRLLGASDLSVELAGQGQVQGQVELVRGCAHRGEARFQAGAGAQHAAHGIDGLGDLLRRARLAAAQCHLGHHHHGVVRQPVQAEHRGPQSLLFWYDLDKGYRRRIKCFCAARLQPGTVTKRTSCIKRCIPRCRRSCTKCREPAPCNRPAPSHSFLGFRPRSWRL